jgi:hypothetical protein
LAATNKNVSADGTGCASRALFARIKGSNVMLVERDLRVMNVDVVGKSYAIASNYLRKGGAIPDTFATNDKLLEIVVQLFRRGETNKIRLANRAIAMFETSRPA